MKRRLLRCWNWIRILLRQKFCRLQGKVLVDFYGDGCVPCAALMPHVHEFAEKYGATR